MLPHLNLWVLCAACIYVVVIYVSCVSKCCVRFYRYWSLVLVLKYLSMLAKYADINNAGYSINIGT